MKAAEEKRLRLEAEDCEKNLRAEVREREAENKLLNESLHEQKSVNKTLDESNRRLQGSLRFQLTGLRSDLDSSKLLDSSLMDEAERKPYEDAAQGLQKSYDHDLAEYKNSSYYKKKLIALRTKGIRC